MTKIKKAEGNRACSKLPRRIQFYLKKKILLSAAIILAAADAFAQGNGIGGINDATSLVTSYFDPGTKLVYAVGAVVGLIGGIKVYNKFVRREVA